MKPHQNFQVQTCYSSLPALLILVIVSMAPSGCLGVQKTTPKTIRKILPLPPPAEPEVMKRIVKKKGTNVVEREVSFYLDRKGKNVLHGKQIAYRKDGRKQEEVEYAHGKLQGRHTEWDWLGNIELEGSWAGGKRVGMWTRWNSGEKTGECLYDRGKPVGKEICWRKANVRDGGEENLSNEDSKYIFREVLFDKKGRETELIGRYPDGQLALRGQYKHMRKYGVWTYWYQDGSVKAVGLWKKGRPWEGVCRARFRGLKHYLTGMQYFAFFHRGVEGESVELDQPGSFDWLETNFGENDWISHISSEILTHPDLRWKLDF